MASTASLQTSMRVTSLPALARSAPMALPIAPAPRMAIFMLFGLASSYSECAKWLGSHAVQTDAVAFGVEHERNEPILPDAHVWHHDFPTGGLHASEHGFQASWRVQVDGCSSLPRLAKHLRLHDLAS